VDKARFIGGLALARMWPVLEVAGSPFLAELDEIVVRCGTRESVECAAEVESLNLWREKYGKLEDSRESGYFASIAAGVALMVVSKDFDADVRRWRVTSNVSNFWAACDDILHVGGGFLRAEFKGVKMTLEAVEDVWRHRDVELFAVASEARGGIYDERLSKVRSTYPKRREIARVLADCAGWVV
jgi:hypothetical protein